MAEKQLEEGEVNVNDLIVLDMCFCMIDSLYLRFPHCLGCYTSQVCICIEQNAKCCKPHSNPQKLCICNANDCNCVIPTTCCKSTSQCCCCDTRCACPCDADVPCGLGMCGVVCCFNYACNCNVCTTIGTLKGSSKINP